MFVIKGEPQSSKLKVFLELRSRQSVRRFTFPACEFTRPVNDFTCVFGVLGCGRKGFGFASR